MSQENVEIVRRLVAALNAGDVEQYLALCAADVQLVSPVAPIEGANVGPEGIRFFFSGLHEAMRSFRLDVERLQALGDDRVLALLRVNAISRGGVPIAQPVSSVYDLVEGKVCRVRVFLDQNEALQAAGLAE